MSYFLRLCRHGLLHLPTVAIYAATLGLMTGGGMTGCTTPTISQDEFKEQIEANTTPALLDRDAPAILDLRGREAYAAGHIPSAINIPTWRTPFEVDELLVPLDQRVIVYCERRCTMGFGAFTLWATSFEDISELDGGMEAWRTNGLPVSTQAVTDLYIESDESSTPTSESSPEPASESASEPTQ